MPVDWTDLNRDSIAVIAAAAAVAAAIIASNIKSRLYKDKMLVVSLKFDAYFIVFFFQFQTKPSAYILCGIQWTFCF